ncbi:hypothetical protein WA026_012888 [Henosepilachna vigintioctopunctata]|uniref:LAGLIDADG homing endonuclease n=1 Tax=Henosepilachna vigintioctopunctata TaxID=420089 RepID=A0AAW1TTU4_9CUCU
MFEIDTPMKRSTPQIINSCLPKNDITTQIRLTKLLEEKFSNFIYIYTDASGSRHPNSVGYAVHVPLTAKKNSARLTDMHGRNFRDWMLVTYMWVLGHSFIRENDIADQLTNEGRCLDTMDMLSAGLQEIWPQFSTKFYNEGKLAYQEIRSK